jgi:hypothetical protein
LLVLFALVPLAGCVGAPESPTNFYNNAFGDLLKGRTPPPGSDSVGYPNLASVPPAPVRGAASTREELAKSLADARAQSLLPLTSGAPIPPPPSGSDSPVPLAPPAPPRLAAAPRVAPGTELRIPSAGAAPAAPGTPNVVPADPGSAPALPPAEMMAPPPAPRL